MPRLATEMMSDFEMEAHLKYILLRLQIIIILFDLIWYTKEFSPAMRAMK